MNTEEKQTIIKLINKELENEYKKQIKSGKNSAYLNELIEIKRKLMPKTLISLLKIDRDIGVYIKSLRKGVR